MRIMVRAVTVLALGLGTPAALAQTVETALRIDAQSPGGVSYGTGGFAYDMPVLSIGSGDFPEKLALVLQYRSDSARIPNTPWASNITVRTSVSKYDPNGLETACPPFCNPGDFTYAYNIVAGQLADSFAAKGPSGGAGPYYPIQLNGAKLTWNSGFNYTYTSSSGAVLNVLIPISGTAYFAISSWTEPDGTQIAYNFSGTGSSGGTISTNRGTALLFETPTGSGSSYTQKICSLNLTAYYLPSVTSCPSGVPTVTLAGTSLNGFGGGTFSSVTDATGGVTTFTYGTGARGSDGHLQCIKKPGQSSCWVTNTYDTCDAVGSGQYYDSQANGSRDRVTSQTFSTGEVMGYSYVSDPMDSGNLQCRGNSAVTLTRSSSMTQISVGGNWRGGYSRLPASITDPLSRTATMSYTGDDSAIDGDLTRPHIYTKPEGDILQYTYDARGNVTEMRRKAKPGAGASDIVSSAIYPSSCTYAVSCNKPTSTTDANGNTTSFTYNNTHGGVLTETEPAVLVNGTGSAIAPVKRYSYLQRYAWIKNASGGFSHAATPVWLLSTMKTCRTTATNVSTDSCGGGSADEVVTTYEYGPDTGAVGNNLWLRGVAVTADGQTLRTCYGYDLQGNRIWETKPRAGLSSCS